MGLSDLPLPAINWAFDDYMRNGADEKGNFWMPAPAQIRRLAGQWLEGQATKGGGAVEEIANLKAREADGEKFYGMSDVAKEFQQVLKDKGIL